MCLRHSQQEEFVGGAGPVHHKSGNGAARALESCDSMKGLAAVCRHVSFFVDIFFLIKKDNIWYKLVKVNPDHSYQYK